MYKKGQKIRFKGRDGRIETIDSDTGAITSIYFFDTRRTESFIYLNQKQEQFMQLRQKDKTLIAGRGFGKSRVIGNKNHSRMATLPRAKFFFSSTTFAQLLTKTLPPVEEAWASLGLREYKGPNEPGHYVVGKRPPSQWERPYSAPRKYDNIITFWNGYTIELLSMDRPDLARGGSYDGGDIDEALLVKKEHIDKVLYPSIRGNRHRFTHWQHQELCRYSSMPWLAEGQYLLEYKDKAISMPKQYGYIEGTVMDNIDVLGQEYLERLRDELDPYTFSLEVMNEPVGKKKHGFYHALNDDYHSYEPQYVYAENDRLGSVAGMKDRIRTAALHMAFDFHGWFKCATVWQDRNNTEYCIDSYYRKENDSIDQLIDDICISYLDQKNKHVLVWGEPHGHDRTTFGGTVFDRIKAKFNKNGWHVEIMAPAKMSDLHSVRYELINEMLEENNPLLPRIKFNRDTCKAVLISMLNAEVNDKFQKSKADEKNKSFNQIYATHFSDTVDYYLMQKYGNRVHSRALPARGSNRVT
ncbi:MAG TPA: hypothetical protein PKJ68_04110 [Candidatus Woesebacteria bacterium]|nr:hypothetical protein [Candidatus Woesebacteria bacterium]